MKKIIVNTRKPLVLLLPNPEPNRKSIALPLRTSRSSSCAGKRFYVAESPADVAFRHGGIMESRRVVVLVCRCAMLAWRVEKPLRDSADISGSFYSICLSPFLQDPIGPKQRLLCLEVQNKSHQHPSRKMTSSIFRPLTMKQSSRSPICWRTRFAKPNIVT